MTGRSSQGLGAGDNAIRAVDGAPATGKGHIIGVRLGVDGFGVEGHGERKCQSATGSGSAESRAACGGRGRGLYTKVMVISIVWSPGLV